MPENRWHIVVGEYPPQAGGVADYTALLASELSATGDEVHVWFPRECGDTQALPGVNLHPLPGRFGPRALRYLSHELRKAERPFNIVIQYAPHSLGFKGMNLLFANWVVKLRDLAPWAMFHEVAFPIIRGQPFKHRLLANVQRSMARRILKATARNFVSAPAWQSLLRELSPNCREAGWLPVPSNVPTHADTEKVAEVRRRYCPEGARLIGHFGTFGTAIAESLRAAFPLLLERNTACNALFIGRGSREFAEEILRAHPQFNGRVHAAGALESGDVTAHVAAADVLYQPFPDGITSRRSSVMAGLALGQPIVSNSGPLTEPVWSDRQLVVLTERGNAAAATAAAKKWSVDSLERTALMKRAQEGYARLFSVERTVNAMRAAAATERSRDMRILHVAAGNLFGGVETALIEFSRARSLCPELEQEFAVCFPGRLLDELGATGATVHLLGAMRASRPWTVLKARREFGRVLKSGRFDTILMHSCWCHALLGEVVNRRATQIVLCAHGWFTGRSWDERMTLRNQPNAILANSRHTAALFRAVISKVPWEVMRFAISPSKTPNAEAARDALRSKLNVASETVVILQASRIEEWKGQHILIEALAKLSTKVPWAVLIAGGTQRKAEEDYFGKLHRRVHELNLTDKVTFLGQRRDVRLLMRADIFTPSNTGMEPFGLAFIEALGAGLPVVSSAFGGALEIVDADCGILTPPGDVPAVAAALNTLIDQPSLRERLGQNGVARARQLCDPQESLRSLWKTLSAWNKR